MPKPKPKPKQALPSFAARFRQHLEGAGLNYNSLSLLLASQGNPITPQYLGALGRGKKQPSWDTVQKIASALGRTPNDFLEKSGKSTLL